MRMDCLYYYLNSTQWLCNKSRDIGLAREYLEKCKERCWRGLKILTIYIDYGPSFNFKIRIVIFTPEMGKIDALLLVYFQLLCILSATQTVHHSHKIQQVWANNLMKDVTCKLCVPLEPIFDASKQLQLLNISDQLLKDLPKQGLLMICTGLICKSWHLPHQVIVCTCKMLVQFLFLNFSYQLCNFQQRGLQT